MVSMCAKWRSDCANLPFFDVSVAVVLEPSDIEVLVPAARATWEGLKQLGGALVMVAEQTYGYVLRPLAGAG